LVTGSILVAYLAYLTGLILLAANYF